MNAKVMRAIEEIVEEYRDQCLWFLRQDLDLHFLTVYEGRTTILSMSMTSLNISLPRPLKEFVEERVKEGSYSTPSEYVRELLREDQKRRAEEKLETLLLEGLNSGKPNAATRDFWQNKRNRFLDRHSRKSRTAR
jgi:antitoxin ParD1/3/4